MIPLGKYTRTSWNQQRGYLKLKSDLWWLKLDNDRWDHWLELKKKATFCGDILLRIFFHSLKRTKVAIIQTLKQETKKKKKTWNQK